MSKTISKDVKHKLYAIHYASQSSKNEVLFQLTRITRQVINAFPELDGLVYLLMSEEQSVTENKTLQVSLGSLSLHDVDNINRVTETPTRMGNGIVNSISKIIGRCKLCTMYVRVTLVTMIIHEPDESPEIRRFVGEYFDAVRRKPVPASELAIGSLEDYGDGVSSSKLTGDCRICLEDFEKGSIVKKMGCSHYYHKECIVGWLRINHKCPLCRSPMLHVT